MATTTGAAGVVVVSLGSVFVCCWCCFVELLPSGVVVNNPLI